MSKLEQYEVAIAAILAGIFGPVLFQRWLEFALNAKEIWSLALIMLFTSLYGLARLYVYRQQLQALLQKKLPSRNYAKQELRAWRRLTREGFQVSDPVAKLESEGFTHKEIDEIYQELITEEQRQEATS